MKTHSWISLILILLGSTFILYAAYKVDYRLFLVSLGAGLFQMGRIFQAAGRDVWK